MWRWSAIALGLAVGCAAPREIRPSEEAAPVVTRHREVRTPRVAARSVEGRPIDVIVLGDGPLVVMVLASIHGDEEAGTALVRRFESMLRARPSLLRGRRVVLVPVANPDGVAHGTRHNARGVDLNRNFPAANFARSASHGGSALSEPESVFLERLVRENRPARIVTFHQPLSVVDWDGPGEELARAMAARTSLPARRLGGRPGSLGSWAGGALGIPIITVELPRSASNLGEDERWSRYGGLLLAALAFPPEERTAD